MINSKSSLGIELSKLEDFKVPDIGLEQYSTPSEISADLLWKMKLLGDIEGKVIVDAACGPGFLGLGAVLLGASKVFFVDLSEEAIKILRKNIDFLDGKFKVLGLNERCVVVNKDIKDFDEKADITLQNPPFGVKKKHADRIFLVKAFDNSNVVYSFHKVESKGFIEGFSEEKGFIITHYWEYDFALKATQEYHTRRLHRIKVGCWRLQNKKLFKEA